MKLLQERKFREETSVAQLNSDSDKVPRGQKNKVKSSRLKKLAPVVIDGILRVGSRLKKSVFDFFIKHPIIVPKLHHVTELIVMDYHVREGHCGPAHTLSALREKFWVLNGASTVKRVLLKFVKCRFGRAVVGKQIMAPLPQFRVNF